MMSRNERADLFHHLHVKGNPLILFNIWNAGSAKAVQAIGAKAIATGSWSVAAAHGYDDGEKMSFDLVLANLERIVASVDLPVTIDLEAGYALSYGPGPYQQMINAVKEAGRQALSMN